MGIPRRTLARAAEPVTGAGVRSGREITVRLVPAEPGAGLWALRTDTGARVRLHLDNVMQAPVCTAVGTGEADCVMFVEHLLATLHVHGITDLLVELSGPELPLMDGSALTWDRLVREAGLDTPGEAVAPVVVSAETAVEVGDCRLVARPGPGSVFSYDLEYAHPLIGRQQATFSVGADSFTDELAPARTFALVEEVEQARAAGLLRGGSEENCRVVYPDRLSAPLTLPAEFARHKILDMLGDFYLLGRPIHGHISGRLTGHAHNRELLQRLADLEEG